jgi:hypothetical protein
MPVGLRQRALLAQMVAFAHEYKDPYGLKGGRFFESWLRLHPKSPRLAPPLRTSSRLIRTDSGSPMVACRITKVPIHRIAVASPLPDFVATRLTILTPC